MLSLKRGIQLKCILGKLLLLLPYKVKSTYVSGPTGWSFMSSVKSSCLLITNSTYNYILSCKQKPALFVLDGTSRNTVLKYSVIKRDLSLVLCLHVKHWLLL